MKVCNDSMRNLMHERLDFFIRTFRYVMYLQRRESIFSKSRAIFRFPVRYLDPDPAHGYASPED